MSGRASGIKLKMLEDYGPFGRSLACAKTPSHCRGSGNIRVRVKVSFTTGAVWSAILATAGLLVPSGAGSPE